jgi:hypothetical protein
MAYSSTSVVNEAIMLMGGNQPPVTGAAPNFDQSAAGKAAALLYAPAVAAITRQSAWDFARTLATLAVTGNTPPVQFAYEYAYPANCDQVTQVSPAGGIDPNNPLPVNWVVGNAVVDGAPTKVIWTDLGPAVAFFSSSAPLENIWDPLFHQGVVRLLSSAMSEAIAGKPDLAMSMIEQASQFTQLGETRDS